MVKLDIHILAIFVFMWGISNLSGSFITDTPLNALLIFKGLLGVGIGLYLFIGAKGIIILYRGEKNGGNRGS